MAEVLVAATVLAFAASPLLAGIHFVRTQSSKAQTHRIAQTLLLGELDAKRAAGRTDPLVVGTTSRTENLADGSRATIETTTTLIPGYDNLYSVKAVVSWQRKGGSIQRVEEVETYILAPDT